MRMDLVRDTDYLLIKAYMCLCITLELIVRLILKILWLCLDNLKPAERNVMEGNEAEWNKDFIQLFGYFTTE